MDGSAIQDGLSNHGQASRLCAHSPETHAKNKKKDGRAPHILPSQNPLCREFQSCGVLCLPYSFLWR
jgi:hypothetical protein